MDRIEGIDRVELPLGPLEHLKIARNMYLEQALSLQSQISLRRNSIHSEPPDISEDVHVPAPRFKPRSRKERKDLLAQQSNEAEPSQLCVCGNEEDGFYVQCALGTGGCNGWVHPECIPQLRGEFVVFVVLCTFNDINSFGVGMSKQSLEKLEGFVCPLCEFEVVRDCYYYNCYPTLTPLL